MLFRLYFLPNYIFFTATLLFFVVLTNRSVLLLIVMVHLSYVFFFFFSIAFYIHDGQLDYFMFAFVVSHGSICALLWATVLKFWGKSYALFLTKVWTVLALLMLFDCIFLLIFDTICEHAPILGKIPLLSMHYTGVSPLIDYRPGHYRNFALSVMFFAHLLIFSVLSVAYLIAPRVLYFILFQEKR